MRRVVPTAFPADPLALDARSFGATLRAARTASGLTLVDAAATLGISKQTLSDLETGRASIGLATALRVAQGLGVGVLALTAGEREAVRREIRAARDGGGSGASDGEGPA